MKQCVKCGNNTFTEFSREEVYQLGVEVDDDGEHNYEHAGTLEPTGNGTNLLYLECDSCKEVFENGDYLELDEKERATLKDIAFDLRKYLATGKKELVKVSIDRLYQFVYPNQTIKPT